MNKPACPSCGLESPAGTLFCLPCIGAIKRWKAVPNVAIETRANNRMRWQLAAFAAAAGVWPITNSMDILRDSIIKHTQQTQQLIERARRNGLNPLGTFRTEAEEPKNKTEEDANVLTFRKLKDELRLQANTLCTYCSKTTPVGELDTRMPAHINHSGSSGRRVSYWRVMVALKNAAYCCVECNAIKGCAEHRGIERLKAIYAGLYKPLIEPPISLLALPLNRLPYQLPTVVTKHGPQGPQCFIDACRTVAALAMEITCICMHHDAPLVVVWHASTRHLELGCENCVHQTSTQIIYTWTGRCKASTMRQRSTKHTSEEEANKKE